MRHVLVYYGDPVIQRFLMAVFEEEGYLVTGVDSGDDALMTLRAALHPIVTVIYSNEYVPSTEGPFFETVSNHRELYGQHRFIQIQCMPPEADEQRLLDELGVKTFNAPFDVTSLLTYTEQVFSSLP